MMNQIPSYTHFDLISFEPAFIENMGHVKKTTMGDVAKIQYCNYVSYINMLSFHPPEIIAIFQLEKYLSVFSKDEISNFEIYDLIIIFPELANMYANMLNFFIEEKVVYSPENVCFITQQPLCETNELTKIGEINRDNYAQVFKTILRFNYMKSFESSFCNSKGKKARAIFEKLQAERERQKKAGSKNEKDMNLGNMISKLCAYSGSVNMCNVWDMTVYQVYNQFQEQSLKNQIEIRNNNYSYYGGDGFDYSLWMNSVEG